MSAEQDLLESLRAMHQPASISSREAPFPSTPNLAPTFDHAKTPRKTPLETAVQHGQRREPMTAANQLAPYRQRSQPNPITPHFDAAKKAEATLERRPANSTQAVVPTSFAKTLDAPRPLPEAKPQPTLKPTGPQRSAVDRASFNRAWMNEQARASRQQAKVRELKAKLRDETVENRSHDTSRDQSTDRSLGRGR